MSRMKQGPEHTCLLLCAGDQIIPRRMKTEWGDLGCFLDTLIGLFDGGFGELEESDTEIFAAWGKDLMDWMEIEAGHFLENTHINSLAPRISE